jgi:hypothetical protein
MHWANRDYAAAARMFAPHVRYIDPLRYEFTDQAALQAFYEDDEGYEQRVTWHHVLFDEKQQIGAAEYTYDGTHRYHGIALSRVEDGLITHWREYQHIDARPWTELISASAFGF